MRTSFFLLSLLSAIRPSWQYQDDLPTRTTELLPRNNTGTGFVTRVGDHFEIDGKPFYYLGTTAPWLSYLNTDEDLEKTLSDIAKTGIKVVRTWAFNDVTEIPASGIYYQLWSNGTAVINTGENGLVRLDKVVSAAEKAGLYLLFSLTNNWAPVNETETSPPLSVEPTTTVISATATVAVRDLDFARSLHQPRQNGGGSGPGANLPTDPNNPFPPGFLSNSYGGMDTYVRQLTVNGTHDEFYTNPAILTAFKKYVAVIVDRYKDSKTVLGWELANDPRCNSTISASGDCKPAVVTKWHSDIGEHVKTLDPNHLVASGAGGFFCVDCPKLFPPPPPPRPSGAPPLVGGTRKRSHDKRLTGFLTREAVLIRRAEAQKRRYDLIKAKRGAAAANAVRIRGNWLAPPTTKRQSNDLGATFDGSFGVDSEDIVSAPSVDFGSFQFFPDQQVYSLEPSGNGLSKFDNVVQQGLDWIQLHGDQGNTIGKPTTLNGFGIVSQPSANTFTPFTSTVPIPVGNDVAPTEEQQVDAYKQWITQAIQVGLTGITQYQWGQTNLTTAPNSPIQTDPTSPNPTGNGISPNDGYAAYSQAIKDVLTEGAAAQQQRIG